MKGLGVVVPLAISQCVSQSLFHHQFCGITPLDLGLDTCLATSIYIKDRLEDTDPPILNAFTFSSMVAAMSIYASDVSTLPLAPIVPILHYEYKTIKKKVSFIKPYLVSFFWVLASYYQPFLLRHEYYAVSNVIIPLNIFFTIVLASHIKDINDIEEDTNNNIKTPAVLLGKEISILFSIYLCSIFLVLNGVTNPYNIFVVTYTISEFFSLQVACVCLFSLLLSLLTNDKDLQLFLITQLLHISEYPHSFALNLTPSVIDQTKNLPTGIRNTLIGFTLEVISYGDKLGSQVLNVYEQLVREVFSIK